MYKKNVKWFSCHRSRQQETHHLLLFADAQNIKLRLNHYYLVIVCVLHWYLTPSSLWRLIYLFTCQHYLGRVIVSKSVWFVRANLYQEIKFVFSFVWFFFFCFLVVLFFLVQLSFLFCFWIHTFVSHSKIKKMFLLILEFLWSLTNFAISFFYRFLQFQRISL